MIELKKFKEFVEDSKTDRSIENLKLELNSKDTLKNIIKELQDIGINGKLHLKLLKILKRENQKPLENQSLRKSKIFDAPKIP